MLLVLVVLGAVFSLGYYTGQRPDEIKQKIRELSGDVIEQTIGLDQKLSLRREFLQAKARLIEGKSKLLDHQYKDAAKELGFAFEHLGNAKAVEGDGHVGKRVEELMYQILEAQQRLVQGESVSRETLDLVQAKLDELLP